MHLTVRRNGEQGFIWEGTADELDKLEREFEAMAIREMGLPASQVANYLLALFAHGQLPEPKDEIQARGTMRWLTYGVLQLSTGDIRKGTTVRDLIAQSDVTCNITPAGEGKFTAELVGDVPSAEG